jgi:putative endonuclease
LGDFGERIAAHKLESLGMRILERNVRVGRIEVDLIAEDGQEVVFVEVRTRRGPAGLAAESVTPQKLRRMWESAAGYCEAHQIPIERMRIDVLAVDLDSSGNARAVEHFPAVEVPADD